MTFRMELGITKHLRLQSVLNFFACALASFVIHLKSASSSRGRLCNGTFFMPFAFSAIPAGR
jgi:hypothetical protein